MFEAHMYVLPEEKHMLVKVIGFCLDLIDNNRCSIYKLDHKKKIKLERIDKIFKAVQVVPLYGDMQISPFQYVKRSRNFDASKWPLCSNSSTSTPPIDLIQILPQIRHDHLRYICELQECSNIEVQGLDDSASTSSHSQKDKDKETTPKISEIALRGLRLLSDWVCVVSELYSWKLLNPADRHQNKLCPPDAEEYERATRYNYTSQEKSALIQVIALIKGLQLTLSKLEALFNDQIKKEIYTSLQHFVQISLREPMRKAVKNKKVVLRSVLLSIRDTSGDFVRSAKVAEQDPILKGEKGPLNYEDLYKVGQRTVGPSSTQLYLLRTMLESLVSDKTCANRLLRKDIEPNSIPVVEAFHKLTFFWEYLQSYAQTLRKCCDLSQLWYREFYLEMTMGNRIQFPIDMSLPWIFLQHLLDNPNMIEYVLYPFDLYNDACHCALYTFKKQFLYDELEAEVNLCFDQFVYKLSEQIFSHFKKLAATSLLDKRFQMECKARQNGVPVVPPVRHCRYESLMRQRRVQLLGHYIDLAKLIQQRISRDLLKSLEVAIEKFQEGDLTGIVQLEALIAVNRETHKLLKKHLNGLDDFDAIWKEANYNVTASHGRTTIHIFCEVNWDLLPNFCYNGTTNRFVRAKGFTFSKNAMEHRIKPSSSGAIFPHYLWGSKQLNTAYATLFGQYSGFIGEPHFRAITRILGYQGIAVVLLEVLKIIQSLIQGPMHQFSRSLLDAMPKSCKVPLKPLNDEGSPGVLGFYLDLLQDILQFPDVKMKLLQNFREVGNAIIFCLLVEKSLNQEESWMLYHSSAFQGVFSKPEKREGEDDDDVHKREKSLEKQFAVLDVAKTMELLGTASQRSLTFEGSLLTKEKLCCGLRIFPEVLLKIRQYLDANPAWKGSLSENQVLNVDEGSEFYRMWSALQFGFCIPPGPNELTVEQLYGDGLNWAGCTIIYLLGQQKRFEAMDFCNRLQDSQRTDGKDGMVKGIPLGRMALKIRSFQHLNFEIFSTLKRYLESEVSSLKAPEEPIRCFLPPIHKTLLTQMKTNYEELRTRSEIKADSPSSPELKMGEGDQIVPARVSVIYHNPKDDRDSVIGIASVSDSSVVGASGESFGSGLQKEEGAESFES